MAVTVLDKRLLDLIDENVQVDKIATGYVFTEGPLWHPKERYLTFSDVRSRKMHRWNEKDGASLFRDDDGSGPNGNTYDRNGLLITCEHNNRRLSRTKADGGVESVVDRYQGHRLNSPNDVICTRNGDLIFTDPTYGLRQPDGSIVGQEYPFPGVFRFSPSTGNLRTIAEDFEAPNGLVLTDDETRMYIADTRLHNVRVFDLAADGSLSNGREFADISYGDTVGRPDGMKLDSRGNLYVTANVPQSVWVYSADGTLLGFIEVGESAANCAWGGDDWRTLFVTANTSVYRLGMKVAGQPVYVP
jgi:sugar lactone lactonase YvrE